VMTDITPRGYIMIPPFARISRKFISLAGGVSTAAAEATSAERKKNVTEKWRHFMNERDSIEQ
jgi:hypothetical protein